MKIEHLSFIQYSINKRAISPLFFSSRLPLPRLNIQVFKNWNDLIWIVQVLKVLSFVEGMSLVKSD